MGTSTIAPPEIQNGFKKCPFCSEIIFAEAKKCKFCQEFLEPPPEEPSTLTVHQNLKKCPFCSEIILAEAKKCKFCQEFLEPRENNFPQPKWNPGIAAALSLIIPGGGQVYRGKILTGCLWTLFVAIGYGSFILPGMILHLICISFAAIGNPYKE